MAVEITNFSRLLLLSFFLVLSSTSAENVTYDHRSLIIDGRRRLLISASIHYPRSVPSMWPGLVASAKEGGADVIETYVFWNGHELSPGNYSFEDRFDLVKFVNVVKDAGMYLILRIGPFVAAEWNFGGIPVWLHYIPGVVFRSNSEQFKSHMQSFMTFIVNIMKRDKLFASQGGPIILAQPMSSEVSTIPIGSPSSGFSPQDHDLVQENSGSVADLMKFQRSKGALIISEGKVSPLKRLACVAGKGKEVDLSGNFKTPNLFKNSGFNLLKALNPEGSSSSKNNFVNRLDDPNAIPTLGSKINADLPSSVHGFVTAKTSLDSSSFRNICNKGISNSKLQEGNVIPESSSISWNKPKHIKINFNKEKLVLSEDGTAVKLVESCEISNAKRLEFSVVVKAFGKELPPNVVAWELRRQWATFGQFHFTSLGLVISNMDRMPHLPLQCWDEDNVALIASMIGVPLMLDGNMFLWGRREFARVCVRLELDKPLPLGVWVDGIAGRFFQKVEYEKISTFCYNCGMVGHDKSECTNGRAVEPSQVEVIGNLVATDRSDHEKSYGPWILVKHKKGSTRFGRVRSSSAKQYEGNLLKVNTDNLAANKVVLEHHSVENVRLAEKVVENCDAVLESCSRKSDGLRDKVGMVILDNSDPSKTTVDNKFEVLGELVGDANLFNSEDFSIEETGFNNVIVGSGSPNKVLEVERNIEDRRCHGDGKIIKTASVTNFLHSVLPDDSDQVLFNSKELISNTTKKGARKKEASRYLKEIVRDHGAFFVGLVETKIDSLDKFEFKQMMGDNWDFFIYPSNGLSGGILTCWRSDLVTFSVVQASSQVVIGELDCGVDGVWLIATVYGDTDCYNKEKLWKCLEDPSFSKLPFIVGGDFNCILSQDEKKGGKKFAFKKGALDMLAFMRNFNFHEVQATGPKFTWCNNKKGLARILEKLDRCIINAKALTKSNKLVVKHLARVASDHCPLLVKIFSNNFHKNKELRFEDVWLSYRASWFIVKFSWQKNMVGSEVEILNKKLRRSLKALYFWSKAKHGDLIKHKEELKVDILKLQEEEATSDSFSELSFMMLRAKIFDLNSTLGRLHTWWNQRAKINWLKEGDTNSKFFHNFASARHNSNGISGVLDLDGCYVEGKEKVEEHVKKRRRNSFSKSLNFRIVKEMNYLGVKMALRRLVVADFNGIIERTSNRLNVWGNKFISTVGRLQLVNSTCLAIPIFSATHSLIPTRVLHVIEKMCRDYIWCKGNSSKGMHFVAWKVLCRPKNKGGRGLMSIVDKCGPLRARLAWNFINNPESLAHKLIAAKHGLDLWENQDRNNLSHGGRDDSSMVLATNAFCMAVASFNCNLSLENWNANQLQLSNVSWCPPPPRWIKTNVDATISINNKAGIGVVFRDYKGRFLYIFGRSLLHWDIAQVEVLSILAVGDIIKDWMIQADDSSRIIRFGSFQVENEYGDTEKVYGDGGKLYALWAADMALSQSIGVPWIMCQQYDAPAHVINTCNSFYCDQFAPNSPSKPKIWTENWPGWFQTFGTSNPHRPPEDIAFSVARFFQKGGSLQNYYMYHGGTNFGRTSGGPFITTSYDYDAPIDEYGLLRLPKWSHLKDLHKSIKLCEHALLYSEPTHLLIGPLQERGTIEWSTSTLCRVLCPHRGVVKKDIGSLPEKEEWSGSLPEKEDIGSLPEKEEWSGSLPEKEDVGSLPEKEEYSGSLPEASVYADSSGSCAAFLANMDDADEKWIVFQNRSYHLPAWSVSILPDCKTIAFNTAKVRSQISMVDMVPESLVASKTIQEKGSKGLQWHIYKEKTGAVEKTDFVRHGFADHLNTTKDATDYLWYSTRFHVDEGEKFLNNGTQPILMVESKGHAVHVFVNEEIIASASGNGTDITYKLETQIPLKAGKNDISLLSMTVGLQVNSSLFFPKNAGPFYEWVGAGLTSVKIAGLDNGTIDLSSNTWKYKLREEKMLV
ncbi:hypothetical protein M5K25_000663 [Dendrobium thyrsiflorum]|uniref:beta-galactosidase n=2 Tax=Magnoliopsida TaxID=3398 RepID=A0ABD0VUD4_DENTH